MKLYKSGLALKREGTDETVAAFHKNEDAHNAVIALNSHEALKTALTMGAQANTPNFMHWVADRLVHVYGESENVDFVLSLRERANVMSYALELMGEV